MTTRTTSGRRDRVIGSLLAVAGATSFGVTVVIGRRLALAQLGPATTLAARFAGAAIFLLLLLLVLRRPLLPARGERLAAFALGAAVYAAESSCFFMGLERGTAAAVALLFYCYPVVVTLAEIPLGAGTPTRSTWAALALGFAGVAAIVLQGGRVDISRAGIGFALAAATLYSVYVLLGPRLLRHTDSVTSAAWVTLGAGTSFVVGGSALGLMRDPSGWWPLLLGNAAASGAAFAFLFAALRRLGSSRTSVVMTVEAVAAVALAWIFLGEPIGPVQALGGTAVLGAATLIALGRARPAGYE